MELLWIELCLGGAIICECLYLHLEAIKDQIEQIIYTNGQIRWRARVCYIYICIYVCMHVYMFSICICICIFILSFGRHPMLIHQHDITTTWKQAAYYWSFVWESPFTAHITAFRLIICTNIVPYLKCPTNKIKISECTRHVDEARPCTAIFHALYILHRMKQCLSTSLLNSQHFWYCKSK